jgi:hypothetical protein
MEPLEQKIKRLLNELCELKDVNPLATLQDELIKNLPEEYANDVRVLVARCIDRQDALADDIKSAEAEVKQAVIEHGESVTIPPVSALLVSGRTSWDGKGLSGYAVAHPEILTFQSKGAPYVTLRFK